MRRTQWAKRATFQGELFARLVERFAQDTEVHTQVCPDLVVGQITLPLALSDEISQFLI